VDHNARPRAVDDVVLVPIHRQIERNGRGGKPLEKVCRKRDGGSLQAAWEKICRSTTISFSTFIHGVPRGSHVDCADSRYSLPSFMACTFQYTQHVSNCFAKTVEFDNPFEGLTLLCAQIRPFSLILLPFFFMGGSFAPSL